MIVFLVIVYMAQQNVSLSDPRTLTLAEVKIHSKEIGAGAYGKVFAAEYHGSPCAAKEFNSILKPTLEVSSKGNQKPRESILKKCQRIHQLSHPSVVQFFGVYYKPGSSTVPLLVMEVMDTSLSVLLKDHPNIPTGSKYSILFDVSLGLKFLHCQKPASVVHCNLSSHNILLSSSLHAKISGLEVSLIVPESSLKQFMKITCFIAPEVSKPTAASKFSNPSIDVYSYGMITLHIITQKWPELKKQPNSSTSQCQSYIDKISSDNKELGILVGSCLDDVPSKRPTVDKVSEKIKKMAEEYPATIKNSIAWQTELQQIKEQNSWLENEISSRNQKDEQKQREIDQLKHKIELLRKQIQEKSDTGYRDENVGTLMTLVKEKEDESPQTNSEIENLSEEVERPDQQTQIQTQEFGTGNSDHSSSVSEEEQVSLKLVISPEIHSSSGHIVPVTTQSNSVEESSVNTTRSKQLMTSDNANGNTEVGDVTRHVNPFTKLEKITLPYEFEDSGPKVVEFQNLGNTCYLNSILQCIQQTVGLHYAVAEGERKYVIMNKKEPLAVTMTANNGPVTVELRKLFQRISTHKYGSISPSDLRKALSNENSRFGCGTEEDSHEALRYLLSALRQEEIKELEKEIVRQLSNSENTDGEVKLDVKKWKTEVSKGITTVIDDMISIQLVSTIVCHNCAIPLQIEELHLDLSLPMPLRQAEEATLADGVAKIVKCKEELNTYLKEGKKYHYAHSTCHKADYNTGLEQALSEFTDLDILDEDNKFSCHNCNISELQRVSKLFLINHLSPVMILQLKRFSIGSYSVVKDNDDVSIPLVLNMAPYCTSGCIQKQADKNGEILYGLYAVVVHHGSSLHSGHYTAFVRQHPAPELSHQLTEKLISTYVYDHGSAEIGKWYCTNDSYITTVYEFSEVKRSQAYLLFYEQLAIT